MGKLEKVIVLSVLFVVAVILVVSLTTENPLDKRNVTVLGAPTTTVEPPVNPVNPTETAALPAGQAPATQPAAEAPGVLLNSTVGTAPVAQPTVTTAPAPIPTGSILIRADGLQDSYMEDFKFYTWKQGDTFRAVAGMYYGDEMKFPVLRRANEGRKQVQVGEKILVPVFDPDTTAGAAPIAQPVKVANTAVAPAPKGAAVASGAGRVHVVKEGESLWKIAKAELGNGGLWNKIYEANRDVLKSPEALKTGMKLKIP